LLITEATIEQIKRKIPIFTKKYFDNDENLAIQELPNIIEPDPTKGKYSEWLIKQRIQGKSKPKDNNQLTKALKLFHYYKERKKLKNNDINSYSPDELFTTVDNLEKQEHGLTKSERHKVRHGIELPDGAEWVIENDDMAIAKITTVEAAVELSSGTKWCTANESSAKKYISQSPLYMAFKQSGDEFKRYALIHYGPGVENEFRNTWNDGFGTDEMLEFRGLLEHEVYPNGDSEMLLLRALASGVANTKDESIIMQDPNYSYRYAKYVIKGRWPEAEPVILTDPHCSISYAKYVIKGRWPEAEPVIMTDAQWSCWYAMDVVKGRWPEGERAIMQDPNYSYRYARDVIKGRWPEAEPVIMKNGHYSYLYARDVIKGRWPEAEPVIMTDAQWSCWYAAFVIKGRWPEAEPVIAQDARTAYDYARDVIGGRWPEAEPTMMKSARWAYFYALGVIKGRWPEAEPVIMTDAHWAHFYATRVIKGRWPEAEPTIMTDVHGWYDAGNYAKANNLKIVNGEFVKI